MRNLNKPINLEYYENWTENNSQTINFAHVHQHSVENVELSSKQMLNYRLSYLVKTNSQNFHLISYSYFRFTPKRNQLVFTHEKFSHTGWRRIVYFISSRNLANSHDCWFISTPWFQIKLFLCIEFAIKEYWLTISDIIFFWEHKRQIKVFLNHQMRFRNCNGGVLS